MSIFKLCFFNAFLFLSISAYAENKIVRIDIQEGCVEITTREEVHTDYYHASWGFSGDCRDQLYTWLVYSDDVDFVWFHSEFTFRITDREALKDVAQWKIGQVVSFFIDAMGFLKRLCCGPLHHQELGTVIPSVLLGGKVSIGEYESRYVHHQAEFPDGKWTVPK